MLIILKNNCEEQQLKSLIAVVERHGLKADVRRGENSTLVWVIGDTAGLDPEIFRAFDGVESVKRIQEPFRLSNRKFHPDDSVADAGGVKIGAEHFAFIAGPCSVETEKQIVGVAEAVKKAGASLLRGGAFKPRTSPYSFQGLRETGIALLLKAKAETGLPVVTEIMSVRHIDLFKDVDVIQIGARDMQNYELLKEVGKTGKPVLLKRGFCNTAEEWLMSAEYLMSEGSDNVILCERGIRTFEPYTKNTLDLSSVPVIKEITHLPVIVDPSHASGVARFVKPLSLAAVGAGADGLMIEVHNDPINALCDGAQAVRPEQFADIVRSVNSMLPLCNKNAVL